LADAPGDRPADAPGSTVANENVYIHEFIDILGHGRNRYVHHMTANWCPIAREERDQLCFGVWATVGSTGRWPEVVNVWELAGWDGLVANFEHEFAGGRTQDPSLAEWWSVAAGLRRGGTDRVLLPAEWSPTIDELCADGVRGELYAHELVSLPPGRAGEFLSLLAHEGLDAYEERDWSLVGAWSAAMRSETESIVVWAIPSWHVWAEFEQAALADYRLLGWRDQVWELGGVVERTLLVDAPLAPLRTGRQPQVEDRRPLDEV
jgi:hypothetical protein